MTSLLADNLLRYSAQIALLAAAGLALAAPLRRSPARLRLAGWQLLLALCLLLPAVQPWPPRTSDDGGVSVSVSSVATVRSAGPGAQFDWQRFLLLAIAAGCGFFFLRIALGGIRIRMIRLRAKPLSPAPSGEASFLVSGEVRSPLTFGWRRPVILLPESFESLPPQQQAAICTHELIHVRRGDWLRAFGEEIARALLWFHPAIWLVISRIQLLREQVVDAEAVASTGDRESYLEALLVVAGVRDRMRLHPAPLFLKDGHFAQRLAALVQEKSFMTKSRILFSAAAGAMTIALAAVTVVTMFPLHAPAQPQQAAPTAEVTPRSDAPRILHKAEAEYPPAARIRRIEGAVQLEVFIDTRGVVSDARVLSGPEELRSAALKAALQYQFAAPESPTRTELEFQFRLKENPAISRLPSVVIAGIEYINLPAGLEARTAPRLPARKGDVLAPGDLTDIRRELAAIDRRLSVSMAQNGVLQISFREEIAVSSSLAAADFEGTPNRIRVGGKIQSAKVVKKVTPQYPLEAKLERIQGTVRFEAHIGADGKIAGLKLVAGHPLLVPTAQEAVRQWEYATTHLNGKPVEVVTMIDINFTLSQ